MPWELWKKQRRWIPFSLEQGGLDGKTLYFRFTLFDFHTNRELDWGEAIWRLPHEKSKGWWVPPTLFDGIKIVRCETKLLTPNQDVIFEESILKYP